MPSLSSALRQWSLRDAVPLSYTRALLRAQTDGRPLRVHVAAQLLPSGTTPSVEDCAEPAAWAVVGWYHSAEVHAWQLEPLTSADPELVAALRGVRAVINHVQQRAVRAEVVLDPRIYERINLLLARLEASEAAGTPCHLGVERCLSQLVRRVHEATRAGEVRLLPGWRGRGLRSVLASGAARAAAGWRRSGVIQTDVRHATWLRAWGARAGYVVCHTDGSAAGSARVGGWAWWVSEESWDAGRCGGVVSSNSAELEAATRALRDCAPGRPILVLTDSVYVLGVLRGGGEGSACERLRSLAQARGAKFALVKGHQDPGGHDRADELAWAAYHRSGAVRPTRTPALSGAAA